MGSAELLIVLLVLMCWQVLHPFLLHGLVPVDSVMETIDSIYAPVAAEDTSELGVGGAASVKREARDAQILVTIEE